MWKKERVEGKGSSWDGTTAEEDTEQPLAAGVDQFQGVNAFIGKDVKFKGNISYNGTIRIDGHMEGEIHTDGTLLVGEEAVITATVSAGTIICRGKITGDIKAGERVKLQTPAVLNGSVSTPVLSMEDGVLFNGSCEMKKASLPEHRETVLHPAVSQASALQRSAG